jgi:hypothetical protein
MEQWRNVAVQTALNALAVPVIDGSNMGNEWIDDNVVDPVWDPEDVEDYQNGEHAWCGDFLHYCWRVAGLRVPTNLASPGRIIHPFGRYNQKSKRGPHFCVVLGPGGKAEPRVVQELHQETFDHVGGNEEMRTVATLNKCGKFVDLEVVEPLPGDGVMTLRKKGSWRGHVMMVVAKQGNQLLCIDGNGTYSHGPDTLRDDGRWNWRRRDGVGIRSYDLLEFGQNSKTPLVLVSPSRLDFDAAILSYHTTFEHAAECASRFDDGE